MEPVRLVVATALGLALLLAVTTVRATSYWSDDYTMFSHANKIAPQNVTARNNLSVEWMNRGRFDDAAKTFELALRDHPDDWLSTYNLGRLRYLKKDYPEAERLSRRAIQFKCRPRPIPI